MITRRRSTAEIDHTRKAHRHGVWSIYFPHQGERECARRRRQIGITP